MCHCSSSLTKEDFQSKWVFFYRFSSSIMSYCFPPSDLWVFFSPRSLISRSYHYVATLPTSNSTAIVAYQLKASFLWTIACFTHRIPQKSIDQCQLKHRHHFNTMKFNGCLSVATVDAWKTDQNSTCYGWMFYNINGCFHWMFSIQIFLRTRPPALMVLRNEHGF